MWEVEKVGGKSEGAWEVWEEVEKKVEGGKVRGKGGGEKCRGR